jgi:flagellar basal body-associated protein FliL
MDQPNYENYSLEDLYDAFDHIDKHQYPENYELLKAEIKKRREEGPIELTEDELFAKEQNERKNKKIKKRLLIIIGSIIGIFVINSVIQSIFFPPKPYDDVLAKVKSNPQIFNQIGMPFEEIEKPTVTMDTISEGEMKIPQTKYEIHVKGSKSVATIFATYQQKPQVGNQLTDAYMMLAGKEEKIKIPLQQRQQWGGGRR